MNKLYNMLMIVARVKHSPLAAMKQKKLQKT